MQLYPWLACDLGQVLKFLSLWNDHYSLTELFWGYNNLKVLNQFLAHNKYPSCYYLYIAMKIMLEKI